jgi:hypothetical protein
MVEIEGGSPILDALREVTNTTSVARGPGF